MSLTTEEKAELFDYIASRAKEMKLVMPNGSADWVYNDRRDPEQLAAQLYHCQEWESGSDEDEDDEEE